MKQTIIITIFMLATIPLFTQDTDVGNMSSILNPDGTVMPGIAGSFDASGFEMKLGPSGEPVFKPGNKPNSTSSVIGWGNFYSGVGAEGSISSMNQPEVNAIAVDGSNVYVGGNFLSVGGIKCNHIAKWNGTTWSAMGSGTGDIVYAIVVNSGNVYVGGSFSVAGGVAASGVAKWDGSSWTALGNGFDNTVRALVFYKGYLHAGGVFINSGSTTVNKTAKWNGTDWEPLSVGQAPSGSVVLGMAASTDTLYIGGTFTKAGGISVGYIAKWDGSSWSGVGSGMNSSVNTLLYHNGTLFAGGGFTSPGSYIAQWNGTAWSGLASGMNTNVNSIVSDGSNIYAAGSFTQAGGTSVNRIAKWNGSNWSALSSGLPGTVNTLAWDGTKLFAGGQFSLYLRSWNGSVFSSTNHKFDNPSTEVYVYSLCLIGNSVYIGGKFSSVGGVTANNVAKWNGSTWSQLGNGTNGAVYALTTDGTNLYAGGYFTTIGSIVTNSVGMWNGAAWSALDGGVPGYVYDIYYTNGSVYVGGSFNTVDGTNVAAKMIARWDGNNWNMLGTGLSSTVYAIASSGTDVYAGGEFTTAGGVSALRIAKWDGSSWSALGTGLSAAPSDIKISGTQLYAGGSFGTAGGVTVNNIARWDMTNSTWNALGTGTDGGITSLVIEGGKLYAGGAFNSAGGIATSKIAKWDGSSWSSLGATLDGSVYAIIPSWEYQGFLVGGWFISYSTESLSKRIAKFTDSDNPLPVELTSFAGSFINGVVRLNWQTATEVDNYGFEIERKDASTDWQKIGFVEGHGISNSPKYYSLSDNSVTKGTAYSYRLKQIDGNGSFTYSHIINISTGIISTYTLEQNFPNPFSAGAYGNPETVIRFTLPTGGNITLEAFNTQGEKVAVLTDGYHEAGVHSVRFKAEGLASGMYYYTLRSGGVQLTRKMILLR